MRRAARFLVRSLAFTGIRLTRVLDSLSRGAALASFTATELDALAVDEWEAFGDGPGVGDELFPWEKAFFADHVHQGDAILVVGAGTGRDVLPFLETGHRVAALDITPRSLAVLEQRARDRGLTATTITASIVSARLAPQSFDVVVFSWFCFGYLRGPGERAAALERASSSLRPQGRILITYPTRPLGPDNASSWAKSLSRILARLLGGVAAETGEHVNLSGSASKPGVFFSHRVAPAEIEEEVRKAGLTIRAHDQPSSSVGRIALCVTKGAAPTRA